MLPRAAYFQTLAEIGPFKTAEWHATVAGLVALRLVDDWLDSDPAVLVGENHDLFAVQTLIDQVPQAYLLKNLLRQMISAVTGATYKSTRVITPSLLSYAKYLQYEGKFTLAQDVLASLCLKAEQVHDTVSVIQASLQLAYVLRRTGQYDQAREHYLAAMHYARRTGDITSVFRAKMGEALSRAVQGEFGLAETDIADVARTAESVGHGYVLSIALHNGAHLACIRNDPHVAIPMLYRAMEHTAESELDSIQCDLGSAFIRIGEIAKSQTINYRLALTAQASHVRHCAINNLMYIAILERDALLFELYHSSMALTALQPLDKLIYHWNAADGYRIFGHEARAVQEFQNVHAIAAKHAIDVSNFL